MVFGTWFKLVQPENFDFSRHINISILLISCLSGIFIYWFVRYMIYEEAVEKTVWQGSWLITGFWGLLVGLIPFYVAGYFVLSGEEPYNGRFTLGSLAGIALIVPALLAFFVSSVKRRLILFAILTGLMIGWQNHAGDQFRSLWNIQKRLYQELLWRAPSVRSGTAFIFDPPASSQFIERSQVFAINSIYHTSDDSVEYPYWSFSLAGSGKLTGWSLSIENNSALAPLLPDVILSDGKYDASFSGHSSDALYFSFQPDAKQCLWLVDSYVADYLNLPMLFAHTSEKRIIPQPATSPKTFELIFGPERSTNQPWCYFYQKAELAASSQSWKIVQDLWQKAQLENELPLHGIEYLPFIEADAWLGDWEAAYSLSRKADRQSKDMIPILCRQWQDLDRVVPDSQGKALIITRINDTFLCKK
jgi:hypothetical protein